MTQQEAVHSYDVVTGMLSIFDRDAHILIDRGSTHSFVSHNFSIRSNKQLSLLDNELVVSCPMGTITICKHVYKDCVVRLENHELLTDVMPLQIHDFDAILGMDWLSCDRVSVDCYKKTCGV